MAPICTYVRTYVIHVFVFIFMCNIWTHTILHKDNVSIFFFHADKAFPWWLWQKSESNNDIYFYQTAESLTFSMQELSLVNSRWWYLLVYKLSKMKISWRLWTASISDIRNQTDILKKPALPIVKIKMYREKKEW